MEKEVKRILITGASDTDPYTANNMDDTVEYNYGSLLSIIDKLKNEEKRITDVYLYLTSRIAIREIKTNCIQTAIKTLNGDNTNIVIYPKNMMKTIEQAIEKEIPDDNLENYVNEAIGLEKVNKFGSFYPEYYKILQDINETIKDNDCEKYYNLSSGTSAMQADINLMAITNMDKNSYIMQVDGPRPNQNRKVNIDNHLKYDSYEIDELIASETRKNEEYGLNRRVKNDTMNKVKMLMLKENIESCFSRSDYAGAFDVIENNIDIFNDRNRDKIKNYISHLYHRYIGNEEDAMKIAKENNMDDLYPITGLNTSNKELNEYSTIIEIIDIMKIKYKRKEINDWLLLNQIIIETFYKKIFKQEIGIDFEKILTEGKIDFDKFKELNRDNRFNKFEKLVEFLQKNNHNYLQASDLAYHLKTCLLIVQQNNLCNQVVVLDAIRSSRNSAAHVLNLVNERQVNYNFNEKLKKNKYLKNRLFNKKFIKEIGIILDGGEISAVKTSMNILKGFAKIYRLDIITEEDIDLQLDIYENIQNKIISLVEEEIFNLK